MTKTAENLTWKAYLEEFEKGLDILKGRWHKSRSNPDTQPPILYRPNLKITATNEISIGLGGWSSDVLKRHRGIHLNNKGAECRLGRPFISITDLATDIEGEVWESWLSILAPYPKVDDIFKRFTLVVKDISPDSCFALIIFIGRILGMSKDMIPDDWLTYLREWKLGHVRTTGNTFNSWGALHSSLGHGLIEGCAEAVKDISNNEVFAGTSINSHIYPSTPLSGSDKNDYSITDQKFIKAWLACLHFDLDVLKSDMVPYDISPCPLTASIHQAKAFLDYDHQCYLHDIQHSTTVQLLLPMKPEETRLKLIDAYFEEEYIPIGSKKNFLRNDSEHTWLHSGFGLMGIYRPKTKGSGNDVVISVDPDSGTHIKELWHRLEQLENEAWQNKRPNENPRTDLKGYPNGRCRNGNNAPEEPWFIDLSDTLVAAPKQLPDGRLGSKIDWSEVLDTIWTLYNPVRNFQVKTTKGDTCEVHQCKPEEFREELFKRKFTKNDHMDLQTSGKHLFIASWPGVEERQPRIRICPTFNRYLAACISRQQSKKEPVKLNELPPESSFELLQLTGGFAIINQDGAFLINDWRNENLLTDDLALEFFNVAIQLNTTQKVEKRYKAYMDKFLKENWRKRTGLSNHLLVLEDITRQKIFIRKKLSETLPNTNYPEVLRFRKILENRWGIEQRIENVYQSINQFENSMRTYSEVLTNSRIATLTILGFPLILVSGILDFFLQEPTTSFHLEEIKESVHLSGLIAWLILSLLGILVLFTWQWRAKTNGEQKKGDKR